MTVLKISILVITVKFLCISCETPIESSTNSKAQKFCAEYSKLILKDNKNAECNVKGKEFDIFRNTTVSKHTKAVAKEFPHIALIGYDSIEKPRWLYSGALISDRWVVTTADCLQPQESKHGFPKVVLLGDLDYGTSDDDSDPQLFTITQMIEHPDYSSTKPFNNIALLKLDRQVVFSEYIRPACLWEKMDLPTKNVIAAGLAERWDEIPKSFLIKNKYHIFASSQCRKYKGAWLAHHDLKLQSEQQICAGPERFHWPDHCPYLGSPLQISAEPEIKCMYYIIGLYSFGQPDCLLVFKPDIVYSRISFFVPWIESIVWVDDWING